MPVSITGLAVRCSQTNCQGLCSRYACCVISSRCAEYEIEHSKQPAACMSIHVYIAAVGTLHMSNQCAD